MVEHWSPKPGVVSSSLSSRANANKKAKMSYIKESFLELKNNVSWPTMANAQKLTVLVAVFSILFSLAIWGVDTVFSKIVEAYFNLMK